MRMERLRQEEDARIRAASAPFAGGESGDGEEDEEEVVESGGLPATQPVNYGNELPVGVVAEQDDLSFLAGEGWVRISRVSDSGDMLVIKKVERKILADDISYLGRTWGGSKYWLEVQNKHRMWVKKFYVQMDEKEYGPPKGTAVSKAGGQSVPGGPMVIETGGSESPAIAAVIKAMEDRAVKQDERLQAQTDRIIAMQMEHSKSVLELVGKLSGARPSDDSTFEKLYAMADRMIQVRGATGEATTPARATDKITETVLGAAMEGFKEYLTNKSEGGAVAPEGSSMMERLLLPIINALAPILTRGLAEQAMAQGRQAQIPPRKPAVPAIGTSQTPSTGVNNPPLIPAGESGGNGNRPGNGEATLVEKIKAHPMFKLMAPMLVQMAKDGKSPEEAAQEIADYVPERFWGYVIQIVEKGPEMVPYLSIFDPECMNHAPWLTAVADVLKREHIEYDEPEPEPEPEGEPDDVSAPPAATVEQAESQAVAVPAGESDEPEELTG